MNTSPFKSVRNNKQLLFSLFLTGLFYLITSNVYRLPFTYGDDHRIIAMIHPERMPESYTANLFNIKPDLAGTLRIDLKRGRFRPLAWAWVSVQTRLFHDSASMYRYTNLVI